VAKAATLRSAPAIEVAMLRSGRVLQRSKNRFDSPMARRCDSATWMGFSDRKYPHRNPYARALPPSL